MNGSCKFFSESSKPNAVERQGACNNTVHKPIIRGKMQTSTEDKDSSLFCARYNLTFSSNNKFVGKQDQIFPVISTNKSVRTMKIANG